MYVPCCSLCKCGCVGRGENGRKSQTPHLLNTESNVTECGLSVPKSCNACGRMRQDKTALLLCPGKNHDGGHVFTNSSLRQRVGASLITSLAHESWVKMAGQDTLHSVNLQCLIGSQEQPPWQLW